MIAATVGVGLGAGFLIAETGTVQRTLLEVTLPLNHEDIIRQQAADKGVPADLIAALIWRESRFRDQTSSAGARGLMQITPQTASEIKKLSGGQTFRFSDLSDPDINIRYGTFYLRTLLDRFGGNEVAALAAYNAGPGTVESWGGSALTLGRIPDSGVQGYVKDILAKRADYRHSYRSELGL